jgi:hypothetical protein
MSAVSVFGFKPPLSKSTPQGIDGSAVTAGRSGTACLGPAEAVAAEAPKEIAATPDASTATALPKLLRFTFESFCSFTRRNRNNSLGTASCLLCPHINLLSK